MKYTPLKFSYAENRACKTNACRPATRSKAGVDRSTFAFKQGRYPSLLKTIGGVTLRYLPGMALLWGVDLSGREILFSLLSEWQGSV